MSVLAVACPTRVGILGVMHMFGVLLARRALVAGVELDAHVVFVRILEDRRDEAAGLSVDWQLTGVHVVACSRTGNSGATLLAAHLGVSVVFPSSCRRG